MLAAVSNGWASFENERDRQIDTKYICPRERQRAFERIRTLECRGVIRGGDRVVGRIGVDKSMHHCIYTIQFPLLLQYSSVVGTVGCALRLYSARVFKEGGAVACGGPASLVTWPAGSCRESVPGVG